MSACICSDNHISALVRWAAEHGVSFRNPNEGLMPVRDNEQKAFTLLLDENYKSVNYRYSEEDPSEGHFNPRAQQLQALEVIKLSHSLDYQSCEHPGWEASEAKALLGSIEQAAVRALPGYGAAPWRLE